MVAEQQVDEHAALFGKLVRLGGDHHTVSDLGAAGDQWRARALDLDEAQPAGGEGLQAIVLAEGGDVDAGATRRMQDGGAGFGDDRPPIDGEIHAQLPLFSLSQASSYEDSSSHA